MSTAATTPPTSESSGGSEAWPEEVSVLSTLNPDGTRRWLRPRLATGRFWQRRRLVAYALILIFTIIPYLSIGGRPLVLLDVAAREFTIFGHTFLPTDTRLLALLLVCVFLSVFFITALLGRVWCGWACPQTVYMEFIFRPLERFFEGAPGKQKQNWFQRSGAGTPLKYLAYLLISLYLAHTFLAYFVGVERLAQWVRQSPLEHPVPFMVMALTTALMMFDFSFFREQTCIVACPYGRFQSVMLDRNSLIVSYDPNRGEPRARGRRTRRSARRDVSLPVLGEEVSGDCVDCGMCVAVCPTGIDIRRGLQMECIGCAQCIDACDHVMDKVGLPRGLVRYTSQQALETGKRKILRPRVLVYPTIIAVLASVLITLLATQAPAYVTVLRGKGLTFSALDDGRIANPVVVKVVNRTREPAQYSVAAVGLDGAEVAGEEIPFVVEPGKMRTVPIRVLAPASSFARGAADVTIRVSDGAGFEKDAVYRLMGPAGQSSAPSRPAAPAATPSPAGGDA